MSEAIGVLRVLIADRNVVPREANVPALADRFKIATVTTVAESIALLEQGRFDVIVACERLADGSGLQLVSRVARSWPNTLRVFAAPAPHLQVLEGRLEPFGLFQTLSYPLEERKLLSVLTLAYHALVIESLPLDVPRLDVSGTPVTPSPPAPSASAPAQHVEPRPPLVAAPVATPQPAVANTHTSLRQPTPGQLAMFQRALARRNTAQLPEAPRAQSQEQEDHGSGQPPRSNELGQSTQHAPARATLSDLAQMVTATRSPAAPQTTGHSPRARLLAAAGLVLAIVALGVIFRSFEHHGAGDEPIARSASIPDLKVHRVAAATLSLQAQSTPGAPAQRAIIPAPSVGPASVPTLPQPPAPGRRIRLPPVFVPSGPLDLQAPTVTAAQAPTSTDASAESASAPTLPEPPAPRRRIRLPLVVVPSGPLDPSALHLPPPGPAPGPVSPPDEPTAG